MKNILSALLLLFCGIWSVFSQAKIEFSSMSKNLGEVIWKTPVKVKYEFTNVGNKPLVISNVTTSCACNSLDWTKRPVMPNEKGTIDVVFDAESLGRFNKLISVYTNAEPYMFQLRFLGAVVKEPKAKIEELKYSIGDFGLSNKLVDFGNVKRGEKSVVSIKIQNNSSKPYEPNIMHLPRYVALEKTPNVIRTGEQGVLKFTIDTDKVYDFGIVNPKIYLSRFLGDMVGDDNALSLRCVVVPGTKTLSKIPKGKSPKTQIVDGKINVKNELSQTIERIITIRNIGNAELSILRLQILGKGLNVSLKKRIISPGTEQKLKVKINISEVRKSVEKTQIVLITNDISEPVTQIDIEK